MKDLDEGTADLAASIQFPAPHDAADPDSDFTVKVETARKLRALLAGLVAYIKTEYARCGESTTPTTP